MVLVSHKYKFIYIKNRKVASSSVESFFGQFCQNPNKDYAFTDDIDEQSSIFGIIGSRGKGKSRKWIGHKPAAAIRRDLGSERFDKYFKFCVIRNPYEKMVSMWAFEHADKPFKQFCQNYEVNNLPIHTIEGIPVCNFYIRYEYLIEDIIKVCEILGIKDYDINDLPKHKSNYRDKVPYEEYYDDETRKIVYQKHKNEFDLFNFFS